MLLPLKPKTEHGSETSKRVYDLTRIMSGKKSKLTRAVKNKEGRTISTESEQRARCAEHFHDILNRPAPLNVSIHPPSKAETGFKSPKTAEEREGRRSRWNPA